LTVTGVAQSNAFVSSLMRNLNQSKWLGSAKLKEIVADAKKGSGNTDLLRLANFGLEFKQTTLVDEQNDDG
jgi:Tfp pilus assembly protein PilN